jgi:eukaryotic-like serine/threonine-protein kinase
MITPNSILQNRYHIIRELGRGGMGAVYEAVDRRFNSRVAVKETLVTDPGLRRAFAREAQLLNSLRHRALPVVTDFFDEGDGQFLVMQYIQGEDLAHMLARNGRPFDVGVVLRWAKDLLDALEFLHSRTPPIVHRDIKPQNLKLTPEGEIVLLDFGLAKGSLDHMTRMATGSIQGYTPLYAPLEQMRGQGTDTRSDLYSLGATLHHLVTGAAPADALARADATIQGHADPLPRAHELNPRVPPALSDAIWRAMALRRDDRPATAGAMRAALEGAVRPSGATTAAEPPAARGARTVAEGPPAPPKPTMVESARSGSRRAAMAAAVVFLVAGFAGAAYLAWRLGTDSPDSPEPAAAQPAATAPDIAATARAVHAAFSSPASVFEVASNADGSLVATAGEDAKVRLWSAADGREVRALGGSANAVRCVAFGPDGAIASGGDDGRIRVWSKDGGPLATLDGHTGGVFSVAFASDGASLASAGYDGFVRFWNLPDGGRLGQARAESADDLVVCLNPDKRLVAYLRRKAGVVRIRSIDDDRIVAELRLPSSDVSCGAFSPSGRLVALGTRDGSLQYWEVDGGRLAGTSKTGADEVSSIAIGAAGTIATGTSDGGVQTWLPSNAGLLKAGAHDGHGSAVVSLAFSRDGKTLASVSEDRSVRVRSVT